MSKGADASKENIVKGDVALKAGIWYTICTVLQKGLAFLTMPVFTRLMTKSDIGLFNTYASWISLFVTLTTFDLPLSIIRSKHEFKGDADSYSFSVLTLTTIINCIFIGLTFVFRKWILFDWLEIKPSFILPMYLYLLFNPAIDIFATKHRAFYRYKAYVITTIISSVLSTLVAVLLVTSGSDKLTGRFYGQYLTIALVGIFFYVLVAWQGKKVKLKYWRDSFTLCFPMLFHLLSMYLLTSSDKIMITKFVGEEYTALYSITTSAVHIASILMQSMNRSWAPWMLDMLEYKEEKKLKTAAKPYIVAYFSLVVFCMLLAPEIILFLGGRSYLDAVKIVPPLFVGTMFTFVYQMYLQVEFYKKKTKVVGVATSGAAIINIILNLILIPRFGYAAAGFTTLIGYMFMFGFHYFYVGKLGYGKVFDLKFVIGILITSLASMGLMYLSYEFVALRVALIIVVSVAGVMFGYRYRDLILRVLPIKGKVGGRK